MEENSIISQRVLWKSVHRTPLRNHRTLVWKSSFQQPNVLTETFWVLKTNVRFHRFLEGMKLKHLLLGLSEYEMQMLFDAPRVLADRLFVSALEALASSQNLNASMSQRVDLVQRLQQLRSLLGLPYWNLNFLYTFLGNLRYELVLREVPIRQVQKFNGWIRTPSAAGSKRSSIGFSEDPEIFEFSLKREIDFVPFLLSENPDLSLLGFAAGNLIYPLILKHFVEQKKLPDFLQSQLFFETRG